MMNGDQPKMDALTPMIAEALNVRDQLRVEMGLGSDGWASQNPNMLEKKTFGSEPLSTDLNSFTPEQQRKMDVLVGEHLPVNPNHLTPEQRSKADVYVGKDAMAGQYVPSKATPSGALTPEEQSKRRVIVGEDAGAGQYIDDMTQTFGGMSEGLEAVNSNPWRPEGAGSRPDDYAGMGYSEPRVEAGTIEPVNSDNSNTINDVVDGIYQFYQDKATMTKDEFIKKYPNPTELMRTWDNLISEYGDENLVKEIEQYKWKQGDFSNTTNDSVSSLREIGKWEDGSEEERDTETSMKDPNSTVSYNDTGIQREPDHYDYVDMKVADYVRYLANERQKYENMWDKRMKGVDSDDPEEYVPAWAFVQTYINIKGFDKETFVNHMMGYYDTASDYKNEIEKDEMDRVKQSEDIKLNLNLKNAEGHNYNISNENDVNFDKDILNNVITVSLEADNVYKELANNDKLDVVIISCEERILTEDEALNLYWQEQEGAEGLVNDFITLVKSVEDPKGFVQFFAGKTFQDNKAVEDAIGIAFEGLPKDLKGFARKQAEETISNIIVEEGVSVLFELARAIHHDINKISGGTYIEAEIVYHPDTEGEDAIVPSRISSLRLIKYDDVYIYDKVNPLCQIALGNI